MCDDTTEFENEAFLRRTRLSRRELGIGTGGAVAALLTGCRTGSKPLETPSSEPGTVAAAKTSDAGAGRPATTAASDAGAPTGMGVGGRMVTIDTPDGSAEAFFVAPQDGKHPGVLMWPDIAGLRKAYQTMATRLAEAGYAVLVVNPYYRSSKLPILETFMEWRTEEGRAKVSPMTAALTPEAVAKDGAAFVAWLDRQPQVDPQKKLATTGYCMGGPFTFRTAAAAPLRVGVIASFHGGGLVTEAEASPHRLFGEMKAAALICIAQNDDERQPEAKTTLKEAAKQANLAAEVEVYPAQHGWCAIDSPVYDETQAERAWARMLATFQEHL